MTANRLVIAILFLNSWAFSQGDLRTRNVVLVTADGLRWQELFTGIDSALLPEGAEDLKAKYGGRTAEERRRALLPFFWTELSRQGVILGHRARGSEVKTANPHRFSYPGYAEILTGQVVPEIDSNDPVRNPRQTVLEHVRGKLGLDRNQVAAFASWSVFDAIVASRAGSIVSNAGYQPLEEAPLAPEDRQLNRLQMEMLTPWDSVRHDAVTFGLALSHLKRHRPRLLYIALGETDDWAHDGRYDRVVETIRLFDQYLGTLWETLQSMPEYRGQTTLIVTTDHGRGGTAADWTDHGKDVDGAEFIWLAVFGPDTPRRGEVAPSPTYFQKDVAATLLGLLGLDWKEFNPEAGSPVPEARVQRPPD